MTFGKVRLQLIAATWLSYAGLYCTRKTITTLRDDVERALSADVRQVAHLVMIYLVAYMLGQFATAYLAPRVGNRRLLLFGMVTSVACNVAIGACLLVGSYLGVAVVMAFQGFAQATGWACNVGLMASWTHRDERGRIMGVWGTSYQLGSIAAKSIAGRLFGAFGLTWAFWGTAMILAVITLLFYAFARETPESVGLPPIDDEAPGAKPGAARVAGTMGIVLAMGIIYFGFKYTRYTLDGWTTKLAKERFGVSSENAAYISTAFDWVGFLGVLVGGWWSDRVGSRVSVITVMTLGLVAATAAMWLVGLGSLAMFVVLLGTIGFACMGPDSLLSGAGAMDVGTRKRAAIAAAIINGCGSVGPIVQEYANGEIVNAYGAGAILPLLFAVTSATAVGVLVFRNFLRRRGVRL